MIRVVFLSTSFLGSLFSASPGHVIASGHVITATNFSTGESQRINFVDLN